MADLSLFFQVIGDRSEFFSCKLGNNDDYFGGFHCYPMQDGSSTFEFFGGGERYSRSHGLEKGSNYQLTVTKDYQLTLCEYSDEAGVGKTLFSYDLKEECPEFRTAGTVPDDPASLLQFSHGTSIKKLYLGADGKLTEEKTEADETTEAADTTTAESETTTSAAVTTTASSAEAAPVTETNAQTQTEAITTTSGGGGFIERAMNADTKTLYGIIGVCAAVLIGGILLYVKFGGSKKRRGGNDDPPYTPNPGHKSSIPMPAMLQGEVTQEEWDNYVAHARTECPTGMTLEQYAMSLANAALRAREAHGATARPHSRGRGHMSSLDGGFDTTTESAPSDDIDADDDLTVPASLPAVTPLADSEDDDLGDLTVPASMGEAFGKTEETAASGQPDVISAKESESDPEPPAEEPEQAPQVKRANLRGARDQKLSEKLSGRSDTGNTYEDEDDLD